MAQAGLVSVSEAARLYGKSRKWVYDQIKKYGVSTHKSPDENERRFQLVDLIAHKGEPPTNGTPNTVRGNTVEVRTITPKVTPPTPTETALLKQENEFLNQRITELEADREERKQREEKWEAERGKLEGIIENQTRLLEYKPEKQSVPEQKSKSLSWLQATVIGLGVAGASIGVTVAFVMLILPHL